MDNKKKRNISMGLALIFMILTFLMIQTSALRYLYPISLIFTCLWWAWSGFWSAIVWRKKPLIVEEDPILDEIEDLFEEIKNRAFVVTQTQEQKELTISNLIVAYYLNKLEKKLK